MTLQLAHHLCPYLSLAAEDPDRPAEAEPEQDEDEDESGEGTEVAPPPPADTTRSVAEIYAERRAKIDTAKLRIGLLSRALLEAPQEKVGGYSLSHTRTCFTVKYTGRYIHARVGYVQFSIQLHVLCHVRYLSHSFGGILFCPALLRVTTMNQLYCLKFMMNLLATLTSSLSSV